MIHSIPHNLLLLLAFAFAVNLPLGYLREGTPRLSVLWFVYIHLSIPFLIALRISYGLGWGVVPYSIACAVLGQILGGRARRWAKR